jgi:hypothetical protein
MIIKKSAYRLFIQKAYLPLYTNSLDCPLELLHSSTLNIIIDIKKVID